MTCVTCILLLVHTPLQCTSKREIDIAVTCNFFSHRLDLRRKSTTYDSISFHLSSTKQQIEINWGFFSNSAERWNLLYPTSQSLKHPPGRDKSVLPALFELAGPRIHFLLEIYITIVHIRKGTKEFHSKFTTCLMSNYCRVICR